MPAYPHNLPHFQVPNPDFGVSQPYRSPNQGGSGRPPSRDRQKHADMLKFAYEAMIEDAQEQKLLREPELALGESGVYAEFQISADEIGAINLEDSKKKIELLTVSKSEDSDDLLSATVFIPDKAVDFFLEKIIAYRDQNTKKKLPPSKVPVIWFLLLEVDAMAGMLLLLELTRGNPKNQALVARVENIHLSKVRKLFTDDLANFPAPEENIWWEVWLRHNQREVFQEVACRLNIRTTEHYISFPERDVILALTNVITLSRIINNVGIIAELRLAKDSPAMFFDMDMAEQFAWVDDLIDRVVKSNDESLAVCLLDTGVTREHRLIQIALSEKDILTCNPNWGVGDSRKQGQRGHGTAMAGILLYGDLLKAMASSGKILLSHCLESVRVLPERETESNDPMLYGAITKSAVSLAEINAPHRQRVICMAVSSDQDAQGRPSSWSSAIDQLCFGMGELEEPQRLIILSIGNIQENTPPQQYLDLNDLSPAENPSQAWNALVVGAYTDMVNISDPNYIDWKPIAPAGDLSPKSRTSILWSKQWPIRPDVVLEGGNLATDGKSLNENDDLRLLTTYFQPLYRQFTTFGDTSAATALASHMAAKIWAEYPQYWPETVRALIVHSAEWTSAMRSHLPLNKKPTQNDKRLILRRYGYGVPNLNCALRSAKNNLTMIIENDLQPFCKEKSTIKTKEMNLHELPWPKDELEILGAANVELRVTLSYFIEPNPGERQYLYRHSYASHGLRFEVKRTLEDLDVFKKRINQLARDVEEERFIVTGEDGGWFLGPKMQNFGSIHSDIWSGTAADLAQRDAIAVYPVGGWWKNNPSQKKWNERARYALVVSIRVISDIETDIYTPIQNLIRPAIPTVITTTTM